MTVVQKFDSSMIKHNFNRWSYDSFVYFKRNKSGSFIYLLLSVDDMVVESKEKKEIRSLKTQLNKEFDMKDLGEHEEDTSNAISKDKEACKLYLSR